MTHRSLALAIESLRAGLESCPHAGDRARVQRWMLELAPILAGAVLGADQLARVDRAAREIDGQPLEDPTPFENALLQWADFREEYESFALRGMTVHERLAALALGEEYARARAAGEFARAAALLRRARVDEDSIRAILRD